MIFPLSKHYLYMAFSAGRHASSNGTSNYFEMVSVLFLFCLVLFCLLLRACVACIRSHGFMVMVMVMLLCCL